MVHVPAMFDDRSSMMNTIRMMGMINKLIYSVIRLLQQINDIDHIKYGL